ncbi:MAG: c-type cytochrome biogenesis protein CcsB [Mycobacterium leprae]
MPVDPGLSTWSDTLLFAAVVAYALAMVAHAAELAFAGRAPVRRAPRVASAVLAGAGGPPVVATVPASPAPERRGTVVGRLAIALTALGWAAHLASAVTRGLAAGRVPWGNMYEFSSMVALLAVTAYLVLAARRAAGGLGVFVLLPVVLLLGLAGTVLYVPAGPLVPALDSYWIEIHVAAAIVAAGTFTVAAVATVLYLVRAGYDTGRARGASAATARGLGRLLPTAEALDCTAYRTIAFAFPVWTFAIIAGAIWAEAAWGRYWGWDPKETWSFVSWVVYAGYLHARTTAGWRGGRAALVALVGFAALVFNFFGVNLWITGLHSYAGL